ncbi:MAG TPA: hypothetical protein VG146_18240, partial [Verrucomicrobiae bacterium]|nr:hypothetical protein [Verrucomicrobiae bacterium]
IAMNIVATPPAIRDEIKRLRKNTIFNAAVIAIQMTITIVTKIKTMVSAPSHKSMASEFGYLWFLEVIANR